MTYIRKNTIRFRKANGRRGSVIVLVVAVLALLAVIGTVYIVSARSERSAASSSAISANLENAQKAVNDMVVQSVARSIYDGTGVIGGLNAPGAFGDQISRRHDFHELNPMNVGYSAYNSVGQDQSWLCSNLYRYPSDVGDMSLLTARGFNPSTGTYDVYYYDNTQSTPTPTPFFTGNGLMRVVAGTLPTALNYPDGSGTYNAGDDGFVQLLPFSEANGVRYRFAVRILDTSRMANLNVGLTFDVTGALTPSQISGTFMTEYSLASPTIFNSGVVNSATQDVPDNIRAGRQGAWVPPVPLDYYWLQAAFRFENPSFLPTSIYDLSEELELRSYGSMGSMSIPRSASSAIWPNTLGNRPVGNATVVGNMNRGFYTTYSWSRDLRPYADPVDGAGLSTAYQILPSLGTWAAVPPSGNSGVWPIYPARVAANPDISSYTALNPQQCADTLAVAATNIATAMERTIDTGGSSTHYSADEARAFAANYLTFRWSSWTQVTTTAVPSYTLSNGPSFVDAGGLCLRTGAGSVNYTSDLNSGAANKVFVGYAAQPFLNEVAVSYSYDTINAVWVESDSAIELYNPYDLPLSLDDFKINVNGADINFTGKNLYVPARGYFVLTKVAGGLDSLPTPIPATATKADAAALTQTMALKGAGKMFLMRKYIDRAGAPQWATVDQYDVTAIGTGPAAPGSIEIDFVARPNTDDPANLANTVLSRWVATIHDPAIAEAPHVNTGLTLGVANSADNAATAHVPLYDRTLDLYADPSFGYNTTYQRQVLFNVGDFDRVMRICHEIDPTATVSGAPTGDGPITQVLTTKIAASTTDPNILNCTFPAEASIHFDFRAVPAQYATGAPAPTAYAPGDPRASKLLECLAFTDRVSDFSIDLGDSNGTDRGISKIRIPGQINVNTASPEVLASIPTLYKNPKLIGFILAYRWRTNTADIRIPLALQSSGAQLADFSPAASTEFPGAGIHSMAELQVPLAIAQQKYLATFGTMFDRDLFWARIYNTLTVRSDTFVVYAYLEAVRQNPRYNLAGGFDNSSVWYNTSSAAVSDDPTDKTHPLLRVARKRWVSLVDRSQSNFNRFLPGTPQLDSRFTQPRIVAIKDLPQ